MQYITLAAFLSRLGDFRPWSLGAIGARWCDRSKLLRGPIKWVFRYGHATLGALAAQLSTSLKVRAGIGLQSGRRRR